MLKALLSILFFFGLSQAQAETYNVTHINCVNSIAAGGAVRIVFTGAFAGQAYFNITSINMWGLPFTQQAQVVSSNITSEKASFELFTMLTRQTLRLEIKNRISQGTLFTEDRSEEVPLACEGNISKN